jgi:hypothetical protein
MPGKLFCGGMGMFIQEWNFFTGEKLEPPEINWDEEDRYAIIAFLLMSLGGKFENGGMIRFDDLFGLGEGGEGKMETDEGEEDPETRKKRETRDAVVRECGKFLAGLDDEERYDVVQDEIDKFIEGKGGSYGCAIGGGYGSFRLDGGPWRLWDLVRLTAFDGDYQEGKRRLLKHLARKWNIDPQTLPALESSAKRFREIGNERRELEESDTPYREAKARLAALEGEERELWRELKKHGIAGGLNEPVEEDGEDDEEEEPDLGERIADGICEGIDEFTNTVGECIEGLGSFIAETIEKVTGQ